MKWTLTCTTTSNSYEAACTKTRRNSAAPKRTGLDLRARRSMKVAVWAVLSILLFSGSGSYAQTCPTSGTTTISSNLNTYYPGKTATVSVGATSITLGAAGVGANFGTTPIAVGDIVLLIQMQGAQLNTANTSLYGGNNSIFNGAGFLNTNLLAGLMEFVVSTSAVPLAGGVLTFASGTVNTYQSAAYGATGQYTYQAIRVPTYFNIVLSGTITAPQWNGSVGGVTVINAVKQLNFNGATVTANSMGFRGGGGINYTGAAGTKKTDFVTLSTTTANGSKGEGIAGTPRYINTYIGGVYAVQDNVTEGYPGGSFARGAPGNAGGGATDSDPTANDQNAGGGGGGNGNMGGQGGNGWSSFGATGGRGGQEFMNQQSPYGVYFSPSRLIMGGGGGAGTINNNTGLPTNGGAASGVSGGGIVIINATSIIGTGTIDVSGASGTANIAVSPQIDGAGGGGAAGSILINAASGISGITALAIGGNGGSNYPGPDYAATGHGPGGSGSGGVIYSTGALNAASSVMGGQPGYSYAVGSTSHYGADSTYYNGVMTQTVPTSQLPNNMTKCQTTVLASTLMDFSAAYESSGDVLVSWTAPTLGNTSAYVVERSTDGIQYSDLGQVAPQSGSEETHSYEYTDYHVTALHANILYYRLKVEANDGSVLYSKIVPIRLTGGDDKISIYPNPATDYAVLNIYSGTQGTATMRLIDNSGRQILTRSFMVTNGSNSIVLDHLAGLPKGIYFLQVYSGNTTYSEKLLKN